MEGVDRYASRTRQKFAAFFITSEYISGGEPASYEESDKFTIIQPATTKISEKCPNLVVNTNSMAKSEVTVSELKIIN